MIKYTIILINKKAVGHVLVIFEQVKEECKLIFISDQVKEGCNFVLCIYDQVKVLDLVAFISVQVKEECDFVLFISHQVKVALNLVLFISVQMKRVMNRAIRMLMCTSCILSPQVVSIIETQARHNASDFEVL